MKDFLSLTFFADTLSAQLDPMCCTWRFCLAVPIPHTIWVMRVCEFMQLVTPWALITLPILCQRSSGPSVHIGQFTTDAAYNTALPRFEKEGKEERKKISNMCFSFDLPYQACMNPRR